MVLSKQIRLFLWIRLTCLVNVFLFLATSSLPGADSSFAKTPSSAELTRAVVQVSSLIQQGQFDAARRELQQQSFNNTLTDQLSHLLLEYESIQNKRETERRELYQQNVKELEALQAVQPDHADGAEKTLATIAHLFEYADESQKEYWRNNVFIQDVIEQAICFAAEKEAQGKWGQAYSQCYYWLETIDPNNADYKTHAEELIEKATVMLSLKDSSCEKALDRYEGIRVEMLNRALEAIDFKYVSRVDYRSMLEKTLQRCLVLGEVLSVGGEIAFTPSRHRVDLWAIGVETIIGQMEISAAAGTKDGFKKTLEYILMLNKDTIQLPEEVIVGHCSEAALEALDPYTNLIWPEQLQEFQKSIRQEFTGIGIRMSKVGKSLKIISLIPNTPAYSSGLDAGDLILAVDGESTEEMTSDCAVRKISGLKGTQVTLSVRHPDSETAEDITITRDHIVVPTVLGERRASMDADKEQWQHMIDPVNRIGYIRVSNFVEKTVDNTEQILNDLEAQGIHGLIIDLRSNTGGLLSSAIGMVDLFVNDGLILRSQPRRWAVPNLWMAHSKGTHSGYPLVILMDGASASASEIVAGALQDPKHRRATIVGSRSYGKGSVQEITDFTGYGSQLKFTTAYYHLPSGQPVKNRYLVEREGRTDWGIAPDVEIELRSDELEKLFKMQRDSEVVSKAQGKEQENDKGNPSLDIMEADPQLAVAVLVLKSKIIQSGRSITVETTARALHESGIEASIR
ncbi:MAG: PDZ domain-containing protein [Sedimentisphaerales bacterium]|nr:PDZ domain-containing protein [Sedimentisphaerales bacterium]